MKKIRIFSHYWHLGHDWELIKLPFVEWTFLTQHYRNWGIPELMNRGVEELPNVKLVTHYEPGKYDVALLHIDQQIIDPKIKKNELYRELNKVIQDIPKIVLCHGTPMLDIEGVTPDKVINGGQIRIKNKDYFVPGVKKEVGDNWFLSNTKKAQEEWGFGDYIIHGIDPDEWWHDLPKEPRVCIAQSVAGMSDKYYGRRFLEAVRTELRLAYGIELLHAGLNWSSDKDETYVNSFDAYRNMLGRSLVYFNPTGDSPMPRARTEAMMSGCCVVTTDNHGIGEVIENGVNGFLVGQDPIEVSKLIYDLITNRYQETIEIGKRGRQTAIKKLGIKRFKDDWEKYLIKVLGVK